VRVRLRGFILAQGTFGRLAYVLWALVWRWQLCISIVRLHLRCPRSWILFPRCGLVFPFRSFPFLTNANKTDALEWNLAIAAGAASVNIRGGL
jgi:hypothetical protein